MRITPVGLHYKLLIAPEEVDPVGPDLHLGLGNRKALLRAQLEEGGLEVAVGATRNVGVEDASQAARTVRTGWEVVEVAAETGEFEPLDALGSAQCRLQLLVIEDGREVDQGAWERGAREGASLGEVVRLEAGRAL